ncbi:ribonuclease J [Croceicoccus sp. F390]|uniref:Ribonuclease J n=1 Tax=Croceicoccus esteveae TaxID=3075597 RepID=A0ABU2ZH13_9SPHN|nr:ribonuclease J [Croceicoccus sp. F390]MDT0575496.1 ribonuclease J [Croceicoccus sp. F390]
MTPKNELLFLALGGSGEIGMNVNLYGCDGKWLMVDLGMTFADPGYPGVDLVFADLEFIEERAKDLAGIVLTHAHEDHIGAIPYFAAELKVPLYATPFTAELIRLKLEEAGLVDEVELIIIDHLDAFDVGPFNVRYVPLAHSIAEGNALVIDTPYGRVFHTGDWKLDEDPQVGVPSTPEELRRIGEDGVLALVCDSTNVFNPAASGSEGAVRVALEREVTKHAGKRVLVTTFASNVARLQTLGRVAIESGRQLCVAGRSLDRIIGVAKGAGYLQDFPDTISFDEAMDLPRGDVLIIATGGQGEPRAALGRIAANNHPLKLSEGDVVLFSSRQIPGNELAIGYIMNQLAAKNIEMVTDRQELIHVSGHPGRPELETLYGWLKPQILIPVHGETRHMREQASVGREAGIPKAIVQGNGDIIRLAPDGPEKIGEARTGRLLLDGDIIIPADGEAIAMRRRLAQNGHVTIVLPPAGSHVPALVNAVGLPLEEDMAEFVAETQADVAKVMKRQENGGRGKPARQRGGSGGSKGRDASGGSGQNALHEAVRLAARRAARRWSGKNPQVAVLTMDAG